MTLALVTGATGGLGSAIVTALLQAGRDVIACGRHVDRLAALIACTAPLPGDILPWVCDVRTTPRQVMAAKIGEYVSAQQTPIDLLVCAHGAPPCTIPTLDLSDEDVATVYETDVLGTFRMAQAVGAQMVTQRTGAMVFLSSAHAHQHYPHRVPYAMAKASVCALARALAVELGPYNIRVNSISPWQCSGPTRSAAVAAQEKSETGEDTEMLYRRRAPLGRLVTPEDVADTALWLAENRSMTGQDIRVECGQSASMWHRPFPVEDD